MASSIEVVDERGGVLAHLWSHHAVYVLPDGTTSLVPSRVVFCRRCRAFQLGEHLLDDAEFEAYLKEVQQQSQLCEGDWPSAQRRRRVYQALIQDALNLHDALVARQSPPRCMECGSTEIIVVERERGEWMAHPEGSGRIRVQCTSLARIVHAPPRYSLEGVRLESSLRT